MQRGNDFSHLRLQRLDCPRLRLHRVRELEQLALQRVALLIGTEALLDHLRNEARTRLGRVG